MVQRPDPRQMLRWGNLNLQPVHCLSIAEDRVNRLNYDSVMRRATAYILW